MKRWSDKCAIVSDIGSGIGSEIAYQLISNGMLVSAITTPGDDITRRKRLHIVSRNRHSDDSIQAMFSTLRNFCPVVLVNNVSFGTESFRTLTDRYRMRWQELIVTKLQRMTTYARKTIDIMKEENKVDGYIFNIINVVGSQNLCKAWKYDVTNLSNNLRQELSQNDSTTKVTTITIGDYIGKTVAEIPICEYMKDEAMLPSRITKAVIYALQCDQSVEIPDIFMKRKSGEIERLGHYIFS